MGAYKDINQMDAPAVQGESVPAEQISQLVAGLVKEMMTPVVKALSEALANNTEALQQLSGAQQVQNDRLTELEKQIRLQTPVTSKQASYINAAIKKKARELLDKKGVDDRKAVTKLGSLIRKSVLARYGISNVREIPKYEYSIALDQIELWSDVLAVRDVVKEAKERAVNG